MSANRHLRLAWQADRAGSPKLRDIMITLAVAESGEGDSWAERGRVKLVRERPGHFFGPFPSVVEALGSGEVQKALNRLREKYPPSRVEWMLLAGDSSRGRFIEGKAPLSILVHDLLGPPAEADVRRDEPEPIRGPLTRSRTAVAATVGLFASGSSVYDVTPQGVGKVGADAQAEPPTVEDESLSGFYLGVLLSIALLLAQTQSTPSAMKKAG